MGRLSLWLLPGMVLMVEPLQQAVANLVTSLNPNLFLYLGDVYEDGTVSEFYNWYGTGGTNFNSLYSITNPTIGNHEYTGSQAPGYFDYWNNIPNYYSYNAGGWHFISLNSNASRFPVDIDLCPVRLVIPGPGCEFQAYVPSCTTTIRFSISAQKDQPQPCRISGHLWHKMVYRSCSMDMTMITSAGSPLDGNGQPSASGITEFVAGGGGHGTQTILGSDSRVVYSNDLSPQAFGALKLALNPSGASFSYINSSGIILDSGVVPCVKAGADTQAPSVPAGFTASVVGATQVNLAWQASTDNVGVSGYTIYRDNTAIATVPGSSLSLHGSYCPPNHHL